MWLHTPHSGASLCPPLHSAASSLTAAHVRRDASGEQRIKNWTLINLLIPLYKASERLWFFIFIWCHSEDKLFPKIWDLCLFITRSPVINVQKKWKGIAALSLKAGSLKIHCSFQSNGTTLRMAAGIPEGAVPRASQRGHVKQPAGCAVFVFALAPSPSSQTLVFLECSTKAWGEEL